jgi:cytochrome c
MDRPASAAVNHGEPGPALDQPMSAAHCCLLLLVALAAAGCGGRPSVATVAGGAPERGKTLILRYGCAACHFIPGIPGHGANVGPPLANLGSRAYVAGVLPNTPENLVLWLRNPPQVDPRTAMPNLGVSQGEAADIAAFLYSTH